MEGLVFWLVPVLLLIVFTLLLLRHGRDSRKPSLLVVEPCGTLVAGWKLARVIGDERQIGQHLRLAQAYSDHSGTLLEGVLSNLELKTAKPEATLLRLERLSLLGESRVIEVDDKIMSSVIGLPEEVLPIVKYQADGKALVDADWRKEPEQTARNAATHGYLPLAIASRFVHGKAFQGKAKYSWIGLALLEPTLDEHVQALLSKNPPKALKLLSVLPTELLQWLWRKVSSTEKWAGLGSNRKSAHPQEEEQLWDSATTIGLASLRDRYRIIRYFQHGRDCRVLSVNPEDSRLPAPAIKHIS